MYAEDIIYDLYTTSKMMMSGGEAVKSMLGYQAMIAAKIKRAERFYIGNIDENIECLKIPALIKEETDSGYIEPNKVIAEKYRLPYPLTYISFDCPRMDVKPGAHRFTKGAVIFEDPPPEQREKGFLYVQDCLFYFPDLGKWSADLFSVYQMDKGYAVHSWLTDSPEKNTAISEKVLRENCLHHNARVCLSLLLNCKNIEEEEVVASKGMNRKRERRGEQPVMDYKVLKVTGLGKNKKTEGYGPGDKMNRLHLCRGHFKTFTEEKPLFGKYTGMYWWQPMVRGNGERGIIKKRYHVTPPKQPSVSQ